MIHKVNDIFGGEDEELNAFMLRYKGGSYCLWRERPPGAKARGIGRRLKKTYDREEYHKFLELLLYVMLPGLGTAVLTDPLRRMPLYINNYYGALVAIAVWRLSIGK